KDVARAQSSDIDDTLIAINSLGESDAFSLVIEADATASKPLGLAHVANSAGMTNAFHRVAVKSNANASVIDRYVSEEGVAHLSSAVVDLTVEKDARATWIIIQEENADTTRLARLNVSLEENSDLKIFMLNAGGKLVRQEINVISRGEGSNLDIKGVNLIGEGTHVDVTTVLSHTVPHTNSNQLFRNIMTGNGKGVFQGQIKVHQIAQKTDAQMACNTLVLSDDAAFYAKPELEIFADDVICAHGATVTELDEDHLFYLRARGVTERTARALLVEAFVDEVVEELEDDALIEALEDIIAAWLDKNG
ncbi:MAG: Fe-S cluster assembly protein SufD, partial [Pseudomonadota bacterium]